MTYDGLLLIRRSMLEDVPSISRLIRRYRFREDGSGYLIPVPEERIRDMVNGSNDGVFFSAARCYDNQVVGCVSVVEYGMPLDFDSLRTRLLSRLPAKNIPRQFDALQQTTENGGKIAELRSLAVDLEYSGGTGASLIEVAKQHARMRGYYILYALVNSDAYRSFERAGFRKLKDDERPSQKLLRDCVNCSIIHVCNEMTLVAYLTS